MNDSPHVNLWGDSFVQTLTREDILFHSAQGKHPVCVNTTFYPVIFLKSSCLVRVHPSPERCDAKHVRYTKDNKPWQQQHFTKVFKLFACSGSPHHPPTSLYIPKIVSWITIGSRFNLAESKLDYVWQENQTKKTASHSVSKTRHTLMTSRSNPRASHISLNS